MTGDGPQTLPEALAKQVLARAAQVDASNRMSVSIPELRTAAIEAGISSGALDQALSEIASPEAMEVAAIQRASTRPRPRWRLVALVAVVAALLGATYGVLRETPQSEEEEPALEIPPAR